MQLVIPEFFRLHIVIAYARGIEQVGHRSDHSRGARDVVGRSFEPQEIPREHVMIDVSLFIGPEMVLCPVSVGMKVKFEF
jgi:hypothetical protein